VITNEPYQIQIGDRVTVVVLNQQSVSGDFEVRPNGAYLQPLVGEIAIAGRTAPQAATLIAEKLDGIVVDPEVTVTVLAPRNLRIAVLGEVHTPGSYDVPPGFGLIDVLARAGGLTEYAADSGLYVLRKAPERMRIRFRYSELIGGDSRSIDFRLRDGDVVVAE
jgi:polysaccharide export outer membrane protein